MNKSLRVIDIKSIIIYFINSTDRMLTSTGLFALEPRVIKVGVARISALLEPSTATSAATGSAGFGVDGAFGTHSAARGQPSHGYCGDGGLDGRADCSYSSRSSGGRSGCCCEYVKRMLKLDMNYLCMCVYWITCKLIFAGLDALAPRVLEICIARISALLEPSTATNAATGFPGVVDGAFGTHIHGCWANWSSSSSGRLRSGCNDRTDGNCRSRSICEKRTRW